MADTSDGAIQANPGELFGQLTGMSQMSAFMDSDVFYELIDNRQMLETNYQVVRGKWPEQKDEMVVVLTSPNQISDYMAYTLGLKETDGLFDMMEQVSKGEEAEFDDEPEQWTYDDLMNMEFKLVDTTSLYRYNAHYEVWEDMSDDDAYMQTLIDRGTPLKIVGIVTPKDSANTSLLSDGVAYTRQLTQHVIEQAAKSTIVKSQIKNPDINVFTGKEFGVEDDSSRLDFEDMISIDADKISSAFDMNISTGAILSVVENYLKDAYQSIEVDTTGAQADFLDTLNTAARDMLTGYISTNADAQGNATIGVGDIQTVVDSYLASGNAQVLLGNLEAKYQLPSGTMQQVYCPLLVGMLTGYVAAESVVPELPALPELPSAPTEPDVPEGDLGNAEPTVDVGTSTETTVPSDWPEHVPEGVKPSVDVPGKVNRMDEDFGDKLLLLTNAEQVPVTQSGESGGEVPLDPTIPQGEVPTEPSIPVADVPTEPDSPTEDPDFDESLDTVYATISMADVDSVVSNYLASDAVHKAADVVSVAMMRTTVQDLLRQKLENLLPTIMSYVGSGFTVDEQMLASAFQFNMNEEDLRRLMTAMSGAEQENTYESNLRSLGYAELEKPTSISVYFVDFAGKSEFLSFLDAYNEKMETEGKEEYVISYTDITSIMMSSVRTIIDSVSYVLIAFVAVSLVVSSIMIGIITYISVMERTKEIGVLRAIGASKNNISQVFNAETFIIGLCSGLIGVGSTIVLNIPVNYIIHRVTQNTSINAQLPAEGALILVVLSMLLTIIGGLIPSRHAAKKDPVIALRSE